MSPGILDCVVAFVGGAVSDGGGSAVALACLIALVSGAAFEACSVGFIHFSERGRPMLTALFSMTQAAATVAGVGESIHDLHCAPFYVLGYGLGTYGAVWFKRFKSRKASRRPA